MSLFDLVNTLYVVLLVLILSIKFDIPRSIIFIIFCHFLMVFLTNNFLFSISYMPDQLGYISGAQDVRNFTLPELSRAVKFTSLIYGLFPIPFIDSVYSIAMINFLCYFFLYLFFTKKGVFNNQWSHMLYLFYPSLCLYSSLALREMLVFTCMALIIYYILIEKRTFFIMIYSAGLTFLKAQNMLIIATGLFINTLFFGKSSNNRIYIILISLIFGIIFYLKGWLSLDLLFAKHQDMFYDKDNLLNFIKVDSLKDLILYSIPLILNFLMTPFTFKNGFQILQFLENCILLAVIISILYQNYKLKLFKLANVKFLTIFLLVGLLIYGFVVGNPGTAVRYKFPLIMVYVLFSMYYIYDYKNKES